jgi:beta-glucosidase/6-phospho-beta-glucosidase/beta-galactosidase
MGNKFMFCTGIENSYPNILIDGQPFRVDELEKTDHYNRWQEDFGLVTEMGIKFLRYGPPYYATHTGPGQYNWDFTDLTFREMRRLNITPIVDLCHFGVPDWIGDFQNADWPFYFAEYARAFAIRFPYLQFYTPVNEIFIAATFSAQYGWWLL